MSIGEKIDNKALENPLSHKLNKARKRKVFMGIPHYKIEFILAGALGIGALLSTSDAFKIFYLVVGGYCLWGGCKNYQDWRKEHKKKEV